MLSHFLVEHQQVFRGCLWSTTFPDLLFIFTSGFYFFFSPMKKHDSLIQKSERKWWQPSFFTDNRQADFCIPDCAQSWCFFQHSWTHTRTLPIKKPFLYLTGRKDELVTGQICLITKDVWLLHVELLCSSQKSQEMIVYCHSCNCLQDENHFNKKVSFFLLQIKHAKDVHYCQN